jgi:hypothetical protein
MKNGAHLCFTQNTVRIEPTLEMPKMRFYLTIKITLKPKKISLILNDL